jgi:hypothetical protein
MTVEWLPADEGARILAKALAKATDPSTRRLLAETLAEVAGRLPPHAPAAVCAPAARQFAEAIVKERDVDEYQQLPKGLAALAGRLPAADAARLLAEALSKAANAEACEDLICPLMSVADCLDSLEAEKVRKQALGVLQQRVANARFWEKPMSYKGAISWVVQSLTDEKAHGVALQQVGHPGWSNPSLMKKHTASLSNKPVNSWPPRNPQRRPWTAS